MTNDERRGKLLSAQEEKVARLAGRMAPMARYERFLKGLRYCTAAGFLFFLGLGVATFRGFFALHEFPALASLPRKEFLDLILLFGFFGAICFSSALILVVAFSNIWSASKLHVGEKLAKAETELARLRASWPTREGESPRTATAPK